MKNIITLWAAISLLHFSINGQTNLFPSTGNIQINSGKLIINSNIWREALMTMQSTNYSPHQIYHFQIESDGLKIKQDNTINYLFKSGGDFIVNNGTIQAPSANFKTSSAHMQFITHPVGASHEILFGAIRNGAWAWLDDATPSSNFTHDAGQWGFGAGAIRFIANSGRLDFFVSGPSTGAGTGINWPEPAMVIQRGNKVGIGIKNPQAKLHVNGTIRSTEIQVLIASISNLNVDRELHASEIILSANGQTADFVFEDDYNLRSLAEVENFIKENKHLPGIPSASQMEAEGVNLSEMNKLLLMKIEELTLYTIELKKENSELMQSNKQKELEFDKIKSEIEEIKSILTLIKEK